MLTGDTGAVRVTDFWDRMRATFGPHAESVAELHVLSELGGRTPAQALAAGEPTIDVWRAEYIVPGNGGGSCSVQVQPETNLGITIITGSVTGKI